MGCAFSFSNLIEPTRVRSRQKNMKAKIPGGNTIVVLSAENAVGLESIERGYSGEVYSPSSLFPLLAQGDSPEAGVSVLIHTPEKAQCHYAGWYSITKESGTAWDHLSRSVRNPRSNVEIASRTDIDFSQEKLEIARIRARLLGLTCPGSHKHTGPFPNHCVLLDIQRQYKLAADWHQAHPLAKSMLQESPIGLELQKYTFTFRRQDHKFGEMLRLAERTMSTRPKDWADYQRGGSPSNIPRSSPPPTPCPESPSKRERYWNIEPPPSDVLP